MPYAHPYAQSAHANTITYYFVTAAESAAFQKQVSEADRLAVQNEAMAPPEPPADHLAAASQRLEELNTSRFNSDDADFRRFTVITLRYILRYLKERG